VAIVLANWFFQHATLGLTDPEISDQLDTHVKLYGVYIRRVQADMKHQATRSPATRPSAPPHNRKRHRDLEAHLGALADLPELVSIAVRTPTATCSRSATAPSRARRPRKKAPAAPPSHASPEAPLAVTTFAFDRSYEGDLARAGAVKESFERLAGDRDELYTSVHQDLRRSLVRDDDHDGRPRLHPRARRHENESAASQNAINLVAAGDLGVRVPVTARRNHGALARLQSHVERDGSSRARASNICNASAPGREMAQRLAHEIKNPLTPIQLAVQECPQKYGGEDTKYRQLSRYDARDRRGGSRHAAPIGRQLLQLRAPAASRAARGPTCAISCANAKTSSTSTRTRIEAHSVDVSWRVPEGTIRAAIDRQMLRRVLVNLVPQARCKPSADTGAVKGKIVVSAQADGEGAAIEVEDDGPGVPEGLARAHLRSLLHHEDRRHGPRARDREEGRRRAWRIDRRRQERRARRRALRRAPSGPHSLALAAARDRTAAPPSAKSLS
jgi:signal transduction histidine kinase